MSALTMLLLVAGAGLGAGIWLIIIALVPARPDLGAVLTAPRPIVMPANRSVAPVKPGLQRRIEDQLEKLHVRIPDKDLAVAGLSKGRYLLIRVVMVLACLLIGQLYTAAIWALDLAVSAAFPQIAFLLLAALVWVGSGFALRDRAVARRREMRYALVRYLRRVLALRTKGLDMGTALADAVGNRQTWTFRLIGSRISQAARAGSSPWVALAQLADELGIRDLSDLASISQSAGVHGAGVYSTLKARITALSRELQKLEEARAAVATTRLALPRVLLVLISIAYMAYPAVITLAMT